MPIMKSLTAALVVTFMTSVSAVQFDSKGPQAVSKVVDFLKELMDKSKVEGETEEGMYTKFKCHCDKELGEASSRLKQLDEDISKMESEVEDIQSENGEASIHSAKLKEDIAANSDSRRSATKLRSEANKHFEAEAADLTKALQQMHQAIAVLGQATAEQSGHLAFMATSKTKSTNIIGIPLKHALEAASALLSPERRKVVDAFLQAPGAYASQSDGVLGILQSMRATFESNLESATETENDDSKAHVEMMKNLEEMEKELKTGYADTQQALAENDSELAGRKLQLSAAKEAKRSSQEFVDQLQPECEKKSKEYEARTVLRANEETAIAQAVKILSSEELKVTAGPEELQFLQLTTEPYNIGLSAMRLEVQKVLQKASRLARQNASPKDMRQTRLAGLLQADDQAHNPFSVILGEIKNMLLLISEEQDTDVEKHDLCKEQTTKAQKNLKETQESVDKLNEGLHKLDEVVKKPQTGMKAQEASLEEAMLQNVKNQEEDTSMRKQDNMHYQKSVKELTVAESVLKKAIGVLEKFYDSLDDEPGTATTAFVQEKSTDKRLRTWDGAYKGQTDPVIGDGGAIGMIKHILTDTEQQLKLAHMSENEAQHDFEDNMAHLKKQQKEQEKSMVDLKSAVATAEQEMIDKSQELKQAEKDIHATESFLADIKHGCDFILDNFELRTENRNSETRGLKQARGLLKSSPAYEAASAEAEAGELGALQVKVRSA